MALVGTDQVKYENVMSALADQTEPTQPGAGLPSTNALPSPTVPTTPLPTAAPSSIEPPSPTALASTAEAPLSPAAPPVNPDPTQPPVGVAGRLFQNPQLPAHPADIVPDSSYLSQEMALRHDIISRWNDIIQQIGYYDPENDQQIPGMLDIERQLSLGQLQEQQGLAVRDVTNEAQRGGTLFSGKRIQNTAESMRPFTTAMAELERTTGIQLSDYYQEATDLVQQYVDQRNILLSELAARRASQVKEGSQ